MHRQPRLGRADRNPVPPAGAAGPPAARRNEYPTAAPALERFSEPDSARKMPILERRPMAVIRRYRITAASSDWSPGPRMSATTTPSQVLSTTAGDFPLHEYRLRQAGASGRSCTPEAT